MKTSNCESCSGTFCSPDDTFEPITVPEPSGMKCYNSACGCPDNSESAAAWCKTETTWPEILSEWCNINIANCEDNCNGKFCVDPSDTDLVMGIEFSTIALRDPTKGGPLTQP